MWMEDKPVLDQQFQDKLRLKKAEPSKDTKVATVKTDSQSIKLKGKAKFHRQSMAGTGHVKGMLL